MKRFVLGFALVCALAAGCSPAAKKDQAGAEAGAKPGLSLPGGSMADTVQPGLWRTVTMVESLENPNLPPQAKAMMAGKPITVEDCVTPADVADYPKKNAMPKREGMTCVKNDFKQGFGKISGEADCTDAQGLKTAMKMAGTYDATHIAMKMDVTSDTPAGPMTMKMSLASERLGECKA